MNQSAASTTTAQHVAGAGPAPSFSRLLERLSFGLFVFTLAWTPFPLGSNRPWSWSLLCILIALCWILWYASAWPRPQAALSSARELIGPIVLASAALAWGAVQVLPFVPHAWAHPIWQLGDDVLGRRSAATVSLAPWRTETELMKLGSYAMAAWLARIFASRTERASFLLNALIVIGALYALYALILASLGTSQFEIFYALRPGRDISGPFVNHNSYATYAGLVTLCAGVRLVGMGWSAIASARGFRQTALVMMQYVLGRGVFYLVPAALALSSVIATGSRGGNFATLAAIGSLLLMLAALGVRRPRASWLVGVTAFVFLCVAALFAVSGDFLASRLDDIAASGLHEDTRLLLWNAALRMIHDAPLLGLGLGTYQCAYPLYSEVMMPFVMDKAHNDYLELAAGWGLPAALLWWTALAWLVVLCVRGLFVRRRNRVYPMLAVGASVLVGIHSIFDFSLQMPAVSLLYAAILGLGVAQAFPTRATT